MKKYFKHLLIAVFSVFMLAVFVLQLVVGGGIMWLRSESGQNFVQTQLHNALKDSPYNVGFSGFSYSFPQGLRIRDIALYDQDGLVAELDSLVLRPAIFPLALKKARLDVNANTLVIHRMPKSDDENAMKPDEAQRGIWLSPFQLPDLYFTRFALDDVRIKRLEIRDDRGEALVLSPILSVEADLRQRVRVHLDFSAGLAPDVALDDAGAGHSGLAGYIPARLRVAASLDSQSLDFRLEQFEALASGYDVRAQGGMNLGGIAHQEGGGVASLAGRAILPLLKKQGLGDIIFSARLNDIAAAQNGHVQIASSYHDKPMTLDADIFHTDQQIKIENIIGRAPDLSLSGAAALDIESALATGAIRLEAMNLQTYSALAGIDLAGSGVLTLEAHVVEAKQGAALDVSLSGIRYDDITVNSMQARAQIPDLSVGLPTDLKLNARDIVAADAAQIQTLNAVIKDRGGDEYGFTVDTKIRAQGEDIQLSGGAILAQLHANDRVEHSNDDAAVDNAPSSSLSSLSVRDIDLALGLRGQTIAITGHADMNTLAIEAKARAVPLGALQDNLTPALAALSVDADVVLNGSPAQPVIKAQVNTAGDYSPAKGVALSLTAQGGYENAQAWLEIKGDGAQIQRLEGDVRLPMRLALYPFAFDLPPQTPLRGQAAIAAELTQLGYLLLPPDQELAGQLEANITMGGTVNSPEIQGRMDMQNGLYLAKTTGTRLQDIVLRADITRDALSLHTITAHDGGDGRLTGTGRIDLQGGASEVMLDIDHFRILQSNLGDGFVSSDLALRGRGKDHILSGTVTLEDMNINIPERFQSAIPELNIVEKSDPADLRRKEVASVVKLDIALEAPNRVFVRGWGLDAEFGGSLGISGDLGTPLVNGTLASVRGRYEEFGTRFTLEQAHLRFHGAIPPSPYLDIAAVTDADEIKATVNLSGGFTEPTLGLSSVPSLPEDEILARILFGRDMSRITPFQAIQLKSTLDRFTGKGGGGFDPAAMLRAATGLDDIRVDTDDAGEASVGVGKYLTDKVYMELETGAGESSGAAKIQVEVTPSINVETQIGQDAQAGGGVFWKGDY